MKNLSKFLFPIMLIAILFTITGCEKLSDEELLMEEVWKWDKMTTNSTNDDIKTLVAFSDALMTGGIFSFRPDGTYKVNVSAFSYEETGTWELIDSKTLKMDDDEMEIIKLTKDELVLGSEEVDNEYGTYSTTMYLIK
ncbi:MAG: lipocalin family protein [Bacteroidales bacterium]